MEIVMAKNRTMQAKNAKVKKCDIAARKERAAIQMIVDGMGKNYDYTYTVPSNTKEYAIYTYIVGNRKGLFQMKSVCKYEVGDRIVFKGKATYVKEIL